MNKEIKYSGFTAVPSDYGCADGELAASSNLLLEDGALKPIPQPAVKLSVDAGLQLFLHKVGSETNYIAYRPDGTILQWIGSESPDPAAPMTIFSPPRSIQTTSPLSQIVSVAAVGYILIVSTVNNICYIRYNASTDAYIFLGLKLPDIKLDFALKLNFTTSCVDDKNFEVVDTSSGSSGGTTSGDDDWSTLTVVPFNVSSADGSLSRDFNQPGAPANLISSDFIPFDSAVTFKNGVEYKIKLEAIIPQTTLVISIYGYRNGSDTKEMITSVTYENAQAGTSERLKKMADDWSGITYQIKFLWPGDVNNANCATRGNLTIYKGLDNSDSGSDVVSAYIEYTSDSHTAVMGAVNKFVNERITAKSRFIFPFFVRYAVQFYNGSYARLSEPILMIPNSGYAPAIAYSKHYSLGSRLILSAFAADLRYKLRSAVSEDWHDLILGVDIFVSLPIWTYDQGQNYDGSKNHFRFFKNVTTQGFGKVYIDDAPCDSGDNVYQQCLLADYISRYASTAASGANYVQIAPRPDSEILNDVESASDFRKISSLSFGDINNSVGSFADVKLDKGVISTLSSREPLSDDVLNYGGYANGLIKEYNRRLHICHSSVILPTPAVPQLCNGFVTDDGILYNFITVYVELATEDGKKIVEDKVAQYGGQRFGGSWYFYPDSRATKATFVFFRDGSVYGVSEVRLKRHPMLNGAYWLASSLADSFVVDSNAKTNPYADTVIDHSVAALSSIYVSEVDCPFIFKASSAVTVGTQEVFALSNAARTLSQGQFGQFPLYAFTTEGIWALSVNEVGTYSAVQPIVRDETVNIDSITQIDDAVLFASARGIMLLAGSQTQCISEPINSDYPFNVLDLPHLQSVHMSFHNDNCIPTVPFSMFIANCRMLYDYPHQRIIIYNPTFSYAYVYSLKSKAWGMMNSNLLYNINSYPEALAIDNSGRIVDFSAYGDKMPGLLITRPLKLELPDILKTVDTVIQRGNFRKGNVQSVLYGSRDLRNWHLVWSSKDHFLRGFRGTPYKYFRIALLCNLQPGESIYGASIQFTPRLTNQPR